MQAYYACEWIIVENKGAIVKKSGVLLVCLYFCGWAGAMQEPVRPFESDQKPRVLNPIDSKVFLVIRAQGLEPARLCSDEVFIRRVYLDVVGA